MCIGLVPCGGGEKFDAAGTSHAQTHYLLDAKWEHHHLATSTHKNINWMSKCFGIRL
jgi:hypothetical protein